MFERYTEHARRVIFFARYESSQFGSDVIEPEHFLLGLFREDASLMDRFVPKAVAEVREQIEREKPPRPKISTNVDLPLSHSAKRVLAYGLEEAERMIHSQVGTEHLLLGLLREPSLATRLLEARGVRLEAVREQIVRSGVAAKSQPLTPEEAAAEREALRSLIESLPDDGLRRTRDTIEHLQRFPRHQPPFRQTPIGKTRQWMQARSGHMGSFGWFQEGHFSSSRIENGTMIFETRRVYNGHRFTMIEKLQVSEDGKTVHYSQELRGPKGEHSWSQDFDLT
jgi:hypothetical protein